MDQPVTVRLSQPIQAHGESHTELTFRPPTGKDFRDAGASRLPDGAADTMWDYRLIGGCCGVPPSTIDAMPVRDVLKLNRILRDFLADTMDETSSPPTTAADGSGDAA
ncbi:phage tail assembly protein [Acetobacteraceae bacterium KSS8]|uniref:Phage tail assembly protein n=1 Tax=Endosaccharibacter trunci TaxID=2812733 RepID=A0ABT1WAK1_9PROT|nr:phage tail assembly protein [Acetobacteraceae bacterium KSS8]